MALNIWLYQCNYLQIQCHVACNQHQTHKNFPVDKRSFCLVGKFTYNTYLTVDKAEESLFRAKTKETS